METKLNIDDLSANAKEASQFLKALAHPSRLLILCNLVDGELSAGELADSVGISRPNLSQHLSKLKEQGFVANSRSATTLHYRIADPRTDAIIRLLYEMFCADPTSNHTTKRLENSNVD
jgi:DNA-binding transcriptional ArsR family regulator